MAEKSPIERDLEEFEAQLYFNSEKTICAICGSPFKGDFCPICGFPAPKTSSPYQLLLPRITIPELEKPENARWLALLIDTEGALGWTREVRRKNRIDEEYRHVYVYRTPYVNASMDELESKKTIDKGARLAGVSAYSEEDPRTGKPLRYFSIRFGRGLLTIRYIKPYLVKFERLANLCIVLFNYHTGIPIEKFDRVISMLFGTYLPPSEVNERLLTMSEAQFKALMERAETLTDTYLR